MSVAMRITSALCSYPHFFPTEPCSKPLPPPPRCHASNLFICFHFAYGFVLGSWMTFQALTFKGRMRASLAVNKQVRLWLEHMETKNNCKVINKNRYKLVISWKQQPFAAIANFDFIRVESLRAVEMSHAVYDIPAYATWATRVRQHQRAELSHLHTTRTICRRSYSISDWKISRQISCVRVLDFDRFKLKLQLADIRLECGVKNARATRSQTRRAHTHTMEHVRSQWGNECARVDTHKRNCKLMLNNVLAKIAATENYFYYSITSGSEIHTKSP